MVALAASLCSFRTDNSIKNHFYSTLRRSLRRLNKCLGDKNSEFSAKISLEAYFD